MNRLGSLRRALFSLSLVACSACAASSSGTDGVAEQADELRSSATAFFTREPLRGRAIESLRGELVRAEDGPSWVRTEGSTLGMQWDSRRSAALDPAERAKIVQAAFTFHLCQEDASKGSRRYIADLRAIEKTGDSLAKALDGIGLMASTNDEATAEARGNLENALRAASQTPALTVFTGSLHHQVDVDWEGILVVVDDEHKQLLFARGAFGH